MRRDDADIAAKGGPRYRSISSRRDGGPGPGAPAHVPRGTPKTADLVRVTDPLATLGAMRRCKELEIDIPRDLSIVGFDDSDIRLHTGPPFTAVCQDARMLGEEAALWLTRSALGRAESRMRLVRATMLEINQTTARPTREVFRILPDGTRVTVQDDRPR